MLDPQPSTSRKRRLASGGSDDEGTIDLSSSDDDHETEDVEDEESEDDTRVPEPRRKVFSVRMLRNAYQAVPLKYTAYADPENAPLLVMKPYTIGADMALSSG